MDIRALVTQMTLEEKASLLSGLTFWYTKPVERLGIPSVMLSDGPHGLRKQAEGGDHLGINDSVPAVCFPAACASAASFDPAVTHAIGDALGVTCQHEKVAVLLGPGVNIKRSPLCGRNFEYFSEDPYLAGEMASSLVEGLQKHHIGASVKHFAANSQENRRMSSSSMVDERTLREIYYPAFETVVKRARPWTVMCSYNRINGEFASENRALLTDLLRGEWGFDGYVVSDWGAVSDRVAGMRAGMDLEMPATGGSNDRRVVDAVRDGRLSEAEVDLAVERILTVHQRYLDHARPETPCDTSAHHALIRRLAADCMVLLKNENRMLPLNPGETVAVIGKFAAQPRYQGGGSSHIHSTEVTSLLDALADYPNVTYAQGYDTQTEAPDEALIQQAETIAARADKVVIVAGLPDAFESEGFDRTHLRMPLCQTTLIERIARINPRVAVVLHNGAPVEMPWLPRVQAVIEAYLGGQAVGGATADVLLGRVNPSGRLPETFPKKLEDNPSFLTYGGEGDTVVYSEGVFVGYRYYDKKGMDVLFPFGHGLSYTTFRYDNLRLSADAICDTDTLTVSVDVTNTGDVFGKEVVQLYVGDCESTVFRPIRELKGFTKVALAPHETKAVTFTLSKRAFAYWNVQLHDWHVESGAFSIEIGRSSRDIVLHREVQVTGTVPLPMTFTVNSIFEDVKKSPKAMAMFKPLLDGLSASMGALVDADSESPPLSPAMLDAMIRYMPLRTVSSFSNGGITYDQLQSMVDAINSTD